MHTCSLHSTCNATKCVLPMCYEIFKQHQQMYYNSAFQTVPYDIWKAHAINCPTFTSTPPLLKNKKLTLHS